MVRADEKLNPKVMIHGRPSVVFFFFLNVTEQKWKTFPTNKHVKYFISCYQGIPTHTEQQNVEMKMPSSLFIVFHFLPMLAFNSVFAFP